MRDQTHRQPTADGISSEKGLSIVDILIALAIFSFGMLAVAKMQTMAMCSNTFSSNLTRTVIDQTQKKAEDLMMLNYTDANLDAGAHGPEIQDIFSTSWTVSVNTPYPGAKTIAITTSWSDSIGSHSISASVIKSQLY